MEIYRQENSTDWNDVVNGEHEGDRGTEAQRRICLSIKMKFCF